MMTRQSKDKRIYLDVVIDKKLYRGLLDTGATTSVLGKNSEDIWHNKYDCQYKNDSVITANGEPMRCKGKINVNMKYNQSEKKIDMLIIPEVTEKIILGINFYHEYGMNITEMNHNYINVLNESPSNTNGLELSKEQQELLDEAIGNFLFSSEEFVGCQKKIKHHIDTGDSKPICQRLYNYSPEIEEKMKLEVDRWEKLGYIQQANTAWRHPIVPVLKKNGRVRLCLDARQLNSITKKDTYVSPDLNNIFRRFPKANLFFSVDLTDAFMQTELSEESKEKTAFGIPGKGTYQFCRMAMGLVNSAATQSRVMNTVLGEDLEPHVFHYLDDVVIAAIDFHQMINLINIVAKRLKDNNLSVNHEKLEGPTTRIKFVGRVFDCEGQHPEAAKVEAINNLKTPRTVREVRSLVGLVTWYAHFIKNFSSIMAPITSLIKKKAQKVQWTEEAEQAFQQIKKVLTSEPVLRPPCYSKAFIIQCDASQRGIGGVLAQVDDEGKEYVISFYSHKLSKDEQKYHAYERECLAVLKSLDHFKPYVYLQRLVIMTDHHSLTQTLKYKGKSGRLLRWSLMLQPHAHQIIHRAGTQMVVADLLSRATVESQQIDEDQFRHYQINIIEPLEVQTFPLMIDEQLDQAPEEVQRYEMLRRKIRDIPQANQNYRLENNQVFIKRGARNLNDDWKIVPHPTQTEKIIQWAHDETLHGGVDKTINKIQETYHWKHMKHEVSSKLRSCMKCAQTKVPNYNHKGTMPAFKIPDKVGVEIQIDFKGPFPTTLQYRYRFIIVAQEALSRFLIADCLVKSNVENTIKFMTEKVLPIFPNVKRIKHDRGSQFLSGAFQAFLREKEIESIPTAAYAPHQNPVERANRVIGDALSLCMLQNPERHDTWHRYVEIIVKKINNRMHNATKLKPYLVVFGRDMTEEPQEPMNDDNHKRIIQLAYDNSKKSHEARKSEYNKHASNREFEIGSWVMAKYRTLSSSAHNWASKLAAKYQPVKILKKIGHNTYEVEDGHRAHHILDVRSINNVIPEINDRLQEVDTDNESESQ